MNKIVNSGMKIDLHIHSCFSSRKDGKKVINNTIKNISTLVKNLDSQKVNICSITDHDAFSYDMYQALKESEKKNNSIEKVLPGVEFSVRFKNEDLDEKDKVALLALLLLSFLMKTMKKLKILKLC